jgi:hypothetical protein
MVAASIKKLYAELNDEVYCLYNLPDSMREALNVFRREAGHAAQAVRTNDRLEWQTRVEEAEALDQRLQWIQEGQHEGAEGVTVPSVY